MNNEQFKAARHKLGLTQAELAKLLGVTTSAVVRWEMVPSKKSSRNPSGPACYLVKRLLEEME